MPKKSLILYASWTGNTEKVALRFKEVFEKRGWECDMFKVDHNTDIKNSTLDVSNYDFLCVGSPVIHKRPVEEVTRMLGRGLGPRASASGMGVPKSKEAYDGSVTGHLLDAWKVPEKRALGPEDKQGVVFATYAGVHLAPPKEAEPALDVMACEMEHKEVRCVGRFCCYGKRGEIQSAWIEDLSERPNERDLLKAELFMEETLEAFG